MYITKTDRKDLNRIIKKLKPHIKETEKIFIYYSTYILTSKE